jgi:hypothetical protein
LNFYRIFSIHPRFDISKSREIIFKDGNGFSVEVFFIFFFSKEAEPVSKPFIFDFLNRFFKAFIEFFKVEKFLISGSRKDFILDEIWIV